MAISRQKEARSRDYALLLFRMTSRVLHSAHHHRQRCTLQAFEQFGALYMHNHARWQIFSLTGIRTWYLQPTPTSRYEWAIGHFSLCSILPVKGRLKSQNTTTRAWIVKSFMIPIITKKNTNANMQCEQFQNSLIFFSSRWFWKCRTSNVAFRVCSRVLSSRVFLRSRSPVFTH